MDGKTMLPNYDIRHRTTFFNRSPNRHPFGCSSFFQTSQKKTHNVGPESGMPLVGPMFELTACSELRGDEDYLDSLFPDSAVSYGPTVCSFGLKYNDHNYAQPFGLTPPSMPPHLMDVRPKQQNKSSASCSRNVFSESMSVSKRLGSDNNRTCRDEVGLEDDYRGSRSGVDPFGMRPSRLMFRESMDQDRFSRSSNPDIAESRCDKEHRQIIEVPDEIAVSPSQLSDLDSDLSDGGFSFNRVTSPIPTQTVFPNQFPEESTTGPKIVCPCGKTQNQTSLIQCPKCSTFQHTDCMLAFYNVTDPTDLTESTYLCDQCGSGSNSNCIKDPASSSGRNVLGGITSDPTTDRLSDVKSSCRAGGIRPFESTNRSGSGSTAVNWDRLNEISRSSRRPPGDTDVNLRMPSPPRASKRKQALITGSNYESEALVSKVPALNPDDNLSISFGSPVGSTTASSTPLSTPTSTPLSTPHKLLHTPTGTGSLPNTPMSGRSGTNTTLTPRSTGTVTSSSSVESPHQHRSSRKKPSRALFTDSPTNRRPFGARGNPITAAWTKNYQEADSDMYSTALLDYVTSRVTTKLEKNHRIPPPYLPRSPLCRIVFFDHDNKGLEASAQLLPNDVVTELRGHFLLQDEYEHFYDPSSCYNRYVMFYNLGQRGVAVDATSYGNDARFVRRSCNPNCRLDHFIVQGQLQLFIRASTDISSGTELTIPFDVDYQACPYPLTCVCARSRCPVNKWHRKLLRKKVVPNLDYSKFIESQLRFLSKPCETNSQLSAAPLLGAQHYSHLLDASPVKSKPSSVYSSPVNDQKRPVGDKASGDHHDVDKKPSKHSDDSDDDDLETVDGCSPRPTNDDDDSSSRPSQDEVVATAVSSKNNTASDGDNAAELTFAPIITTRRQAAAASGRVGGHSSSASSTGS